MFRAAGKAEIVRSHQRDDYYSIFVKRSLGDIVQSFFGPQSWLHWRKELNLAADLVYFGLTTFAGFQTLGEEYVNIVQVDSSQRQVPSAYRRGLMILLQVSTPYFVDHILTYVQNQIENNATLSVSQLARERIASVLTVTRNLVSLLHRCHLALFYINGIFYHVAKRILSIHYIRVRSPTMSTETSQSNYRILGWLSVIQLTVTFLQHLRHQLKSKSLGNFDDSQRNFSGQRSKNKDAAGTEDGSGQSASSRRCPLCLDTRKQSTAAPCGHLFCWSCITEWCGNKAECPLCREKFSPSRLIFLQNFDPL